MIKTININGTPFSYESEEESISWENPEVITSLDAAKILSFTKEKFDSIGVEFFLAYGTLLGAIREHNVIKGDSDVDVYITDENKLFNSLPELYEKGLKVVRIKEKRYYTFRINCTHSYIDAYVLKPIESGVWRFRCYSLAGHTVPKKFFRETQEIDFLGGRYKTTANPERLLAFLYGKDWRIPQKKKAKLDVWTKSVCTNTIVSIKKLFHMDLNKSVFHNK